MDLLLYPEEKYHIERIVEMQDDKQDLAERMLSGEGISGASFSKEDLMNMLG